MRRSLSAAARLLAVSLSAFLVGCGGQPTAPSPQMDRVDTIVKSSGGDWSKLSAQDRDYLINVVGKGSPISAQMTFQARAGRLAPGANIRH